MAASTYGHMPSLDNALFDLNMSLPSADVL